MEAPDFLTGARPGSGRISPVDEGDDGNGYESQGGGGVDPLIGGGFVFVVGHDESLLVPEL